MTMEAMALLGLRRLVCACSAREAKAPLPGLPGAFWVQDAGRLWAWRNFHAVEGPSAWRVPNKSGLTLILLGAVLALLSRYPFLLGMLEGWDALLTGALEGAAGLHALQSSSQSGMLPSSTAHCLSPPLALCSLLVA